MDHNAEISAAQGAIVYVKEVEVASLPTEVRAEAGEREHLYAVHNAEGERLALFADRQSAFVLARENDMQPMAVH